MLNVKELIESVESCMGWPYVSPGSNDANGIDCSGLLVKAFRDQGSNIYHGSNTIYRKYCSEKGELKNVSQLLPGMVVFKWNPNTPEKFNDGQGDFQHVGLVTAINPLRIVHASSATGCVTSDSKLGKWAYWGRLKDVDYTQSTPASPSSAGSESEDETWTGLINADKVNLRTGPNASKPRIEYLNTGDQVEVMGESGTWLKVRWNGRTGYVMAQFVSSVQSASDSIPSVEDDVAEVGKIRVTSANGGKVNIRKGNGTNYSRITSVPSGTTLIHIATASNGWYAVEAGNVVGWVSPEFAEVV